MTVLQEIPFQPSTIETIDWAVYNWLNETMNLFVSTKDGNRKIEIIWVSAERAWLSKKSKETRETVGALIFPLITVERKGIEKNLAKKGKAYGNVPLESDEKGGSSSVTVARRINQEKTSNFVNADSNRHHGQINFPGKNKKIVYETVSIPIPVYIEVSYEIKVKTLYQQHMNEIVQPFITKTQGINYFLAKHEGHRFEVFMDPNFKSDNNVAAMQKEERKFESSFSIRVLGHLIGGGANDQQPRLVVRENAVEVKIPREHVIFGDLTIDGREYHGIGGLGGDQKGRKD